MAKCHLQMGNWALALKSSQQVLETDKRFVKAILVKAESLYNTCSFEHALIYYHRGQVNKITDWGHWYMTSFKLAGRG